MDRISNLSDDLLLKIFSSLPTKDVVATMLLSKRWRFLWTLVPNLDFNDRFKLEPSEYERFRKYVDRTMVLNRAPVLQALKFKVGLCCNSEDMATWIRIGMVQNVRELEVVHGDEYCEEHISIKLPNTLYTYEKLEVLKLTFSIIVDVPIDVCFPSLKTLHLVFVHCETEECHLRLLSGCPVLEELVLERTKNCDTLRCFYVEMPNLQRLSILDRCDSLNIEDEINKIVINVPSLKYLNFVDFFADFCLCENMPEVIEAIVKVIYVNPERLLRSLPSVKRLYLCLDLFGSMLQQHIVFHHLVHLEVCTDSPGWWDLLTWMLESSPKLQTLTICKCDKLSCTTMPLNCQWRGPSSVPECLMFHLHTFKWKDYNTEDKEKKIVAYILKSARQMKIVGISARRDCYSSKEELYKKLNELVSLPIASSSCQFLLD